MKTTVELDDELLRQAKARAAERGETLRAFLERGVRRELDASAAPRPGYVFRDASVGGGVVRPDYLPWHWDKINGLAYEDQGS